MSSIKFRIAHYAKIDTRLRMTQQRPRVRIEIKLYFNRNISDMSIEITYFDLNISKVRIARSAYMVIRHI